MSATSDQTQPCLGAGPKLVIKAGPHLFIKGDSNNVNGQHTGEVVLSTSLKDEWMRMLASRNALAAQLGAQFAFLLAPDKQTVYRHLLPLTYNCRIAQFLSEVPDVVDAAPALQSQAHLTEVYPFTDSHWDHRGASSGAAMLLAKLGLPYPSNLTHWLTESIPGDLGSKLTPVERSERHVAVFSNPSHLIFDNGVPNNGRIRVHVKRSHEKTEGKLVSMALIFGDSFAYDVVHWVKESVDIVVHVHSFAFDTALVKSLRPDYLIGEITERFVSRFPVPSDGQCLRYLWLDKIFRKELAISPRRVSGTEFECLPMRAKAVMTLLDQLYSPFAELLNAQFDKSLRSSISYRHFPISEILNDESICRYPNFRIGFLKGLLNILSSDEVEEFKKAYDVEKGRIMGSAHSG